MSQTNLIDVVCTYMCQSRTSFWSDVQSLRLTLLLLHEYYNSPCGSLVRYNEHILEF